MKLSIIATWALSLLPATALALPVEGRQIDRQVLSSLTTQYIFDMAVGQFMTLRETQNPTALDWTSDGCSDSPDNPLGFDFEPACFRHDFGYRNFKAQNRFTESARASIDSNFESDLKSLCQSVTFESACDSLAEVYYAGVRAFGGQGVTPDKRSPESHDDLVADYKIKLASYNSILEEAKTNVKLA